MDHQERLLERQAKLGDVSSLLQLSRFRERSGQAPLLEAIIERKQIIQRETQELETQIERHVISLLAQLGKTIYQEPRNRKLLASVSLSLCHYPRTRITTASQEPIWLIKIPKLSRAYPSHIDGRLCINRSLHYILEEIGHARSTDDWQDIQKIIRNCIVIKEQFNFVSGRLSSNSEKLGRTIKT